MAMARVLRPAAVGAAALALAVVPAVAAHGAPVDRDETSVVDAVDAVDAVAAAPERVGQWPGNLLLELRRAQLSGVRYSAAAEAYTTTLREDAVAVGRAALDAAAAVEQMTGAVDVWTAVALEDTAAHLGRLLDGADAGRSAQAAGGSGAGAGGAARDLRHAERIASAAAELFRLAHDVEVATQEADVREELEVPEVLPAPEPLEEVTPDSGDVPAAQAPGPSGERDEPGEPSDPAEPGDPAGPSDPVEPATTVPPADDGSTPEHSAPGPVVPSPGEEPEGQEPAGPGEDSAPEDGEAFQEVGTPDPDADGTGGTEGAEPAQRTTRSPLTALPPEYATGILELEQRIDALAALRGTALVEPGTLSPQLRGEGFSLLDRLAYDESARLWHNGRVPLDELCPLAFAPGHLLRCDAAEALRLLNVEYREAFGEDLGVVSAYRSYESQVAVRATRGWLAAQPGTSQHGMGVAVDLADFGRLGQFDNPRHVWMREHGPRYGWEHPRIMRPGGGGPPEPWHFEYRTGAG